MGLISEFKEFAVKGNMLDMAVGIIIGGAFGKVVTSLVQDVIMPVVSLATGGVDFSERFAWLGGGDVPESFKAAQESDGAYLGYGAFAQTMIDFLIVAFAVFLIVKVVNSARRAVEGEPDEKKPAKPSEDILLLREIRDSLQK